MPNPKTEIINSCNDCEYCYNCGRNEDITIEICEECECNVTNEPKYEVLKKIVCKECAWDIIEDCLKEEVLKGFEY